MFGFLTELVKAHSKADLPSLEKRTADTPSGLTSRENDAASGSAGKRFLVTFGAPSSRGPR